MSLRIFQSLKSLKSTNRFTALSETYQSYMGYRQEGLFFDDLIPEENDYVKEALARLSPQERAARTLRLRTNLNLGLKKITLDEKDWVTPEQDVRYLAPVLELVEAEHLTKLEYDGMTDVPAALKNRNRAT